MNDPDSSGAPLIWSVEPEADRPAERRPRRRWLYELPYLVIGAVVLGTIVTCGVTQMLS
jgi:hypothetical protein